LSLPFKAHAGRTWLAVTLGAEPGQLPTPPDKPESYRLIVTAESVRLTARDTDGLYWGLTTLQQLLNGGRSAPCVDITDWPAFGLRYHHDDISRKQVSKVEDFKRIIRLLSYYKVKYYTPYMEDMLYLKSYPDIGRNRGRLMPGEVREILAEAEKYNVTVFPTYSLIGHQENLLKNPRYRKYAREVFQPPSSYDPRKQILKPYLRKVIRDVCALFPESPFFHACFDETQGVDEKDLIAHANWCAGEIARYGKKMLMWVDMFKNHYGLTKLKHLRSNIVPVEWSYGEPEKIEASYRQAGVIPTGLAGYNNWCTFLPDFRPGKRCLDAWAGVMTRWGGEGFGSSMWGDDGYENSRDLAWNLFAYLGEVAWRGTPAAPDFEERFQSTFYGRPIPAMLAIVNDLPPRLAISPHRAWRMFRYTIQAMARICASDPGLAEKARTDLRLLESALRSLPAAARLARREKGHTDHFAVALEREINVRQRLVFAAAVARGMGPGALKKGAVAQAHELTRVRDHYRAVWLRHNKRPNIEVSLAVYDRVRQSLEQLTQPAPRAGERFLCLDLDQCCNKSQADVGGLPIGTGLVNRVPFRFAPLTHTHCLLATGAPLTISFEPCAPRDIHLIYGGQTIDKKAPRPVVEVALLDRGKVVFAERLNSITQICDWWAPLGEHIWAGGGFKYVDKKRNAYALSPGPNFGLMHLHGFDLRAVGQADALRITAIAKEEFNLFAATVERK